MEILLFSLQKIAMESSDLLSTLRLTRRRGVRKYRPAFILTKHRNDWRNRWSENSCVAMLREFGPGNTGNHFGV